MPRLTIVLEYEDEKDMPEISAITRALGGEVIGFAAGDYLNKVEKAFHALQSNDEDD